MIDPQRLLDWPFPEMVQSYEARDTQLYGLSAGFGADPMDERQLAYVLEDGAWDRPLKTLPTMATVLCRPPQWYKDPAVGFDWRGMVYGEQHVHIHEPLPAAATIRGREKIIGVLDRGEGRGAILIVERRIVDDATGELLAVVSGPVVLRHDGGFGGPSGPLPERVEMPDRPADRKSIIATLPQAALLFRLHGDVNPLHAVPATASAQKFARPILHGFCTLAHACHALVRDYLDFDAGRLAGFGARFSQPVFPGETIIIESWSEGGRVLFRAHVRERNVKVLDGGVALLAGTEAGNGNQDKAPAQAAAPVTGVVA